MTVASVATIPGREKCLAAMLASIQGQFDQVIVTHNAASLVGLSDGSKFDPLVGRYGYLFVLDDDIQYPPDYAGRTVEHIEHLNRQAVVCYSGKRFDKTPVASYYYNASSLIRLFKDDVPEYWPCHVPITAAMAWHSETISFDPERWTSQGCDAWAGADCFDAGVQVVCAPHLASDFSDLSGLSETEYKAFAANSRADGPQTELINARAWT